MGWAAGLPMTPGARPSPGFCSVLQIRSGHDAGHGLHPLEHPAQPAHQHHGLCRNAHQQHQRRRHGGPPAQAPFEEDPEPAAIAAGTASARASSAAYATIISMFCPSASTPPGRLLPRCTHAGKSSAAPFWISMPRKLMPGRQTAAAASTAVRRSRGRLQIRDARGTRCTRRAAARAAAQVSTSGGGGGLRGDDRRPRSG